MKRTNFHLKPPKLKLLRVSDWKGERGDHQKRIVLLSDMLNVQVKCRAAVRGLYTRVPGEVIRKQLALIGDYTVNGVKTRYILMQHMKACCSLDKDKELFIEKDRERKEMRFVMDLFRRVVALPNNLSNEHWDNFIAHMRDFHLGETLQFGGYEGFRKLAYRELRLTYKHDPIMCLEVVRKLEPLEDEQKAGMKEMQIATNEQTEQKVDKINR